MIMKKTERQSVFMQMHNGTRAGEGSFNVALKDLFYKADVKNRYKLVDAFPEFFGEEVPEFGITKMGKKKAVVDLTHMTQVAIGNGNVQIGRATNKTFKYKGWECKWIKSENMFYLYTPEEMEQPAQFRYAECELETAEMCRKFINSY
jgi:hypothetical protein